MNASEFMLVGSNSITQGTKIYETTGPTANSPTVKVWDAADPYVGYSSYCLSGSFTYMHCDVEFTDLDADDNPFCPWDFELDEYAYPGDHCNDSVAYICMGNGFGPRGGDSGGPIYIKYGSGSSLYGYAQMKGIVIGMETFFGVCGWAELWSEMTSTYPITIKQAP